MIVYDKEQKEIVIPNGIGNINLYNNGVEAGYNQGYEQGQADMAAQARVLDVTENGVYRTKFSDPIPPELVTGVYADGTEFHNYAELNGKVFNTKITATKNSRLEFWYKGDGIVSGDGWNVIIGAGNNYDENCFQVRNFGSINYVIQIDLGSDKILVQRWDDTVWHHLIISRAEGVWVDGKKEGDFSPTTNTINGEFYINGISYNVNGSIGLRRNANGTFGMIKIDNTIIIPTADGFLNTNTGELLEVVHRGDYTFTENLPTYGEGELYKTINVNVPDLNGSYDEGYGQGKTDGINEQKSKLETINITQNGTYTKEDGYNQIDVNVNVIPKINVKEAGIKFAYGKFEEVPEYVTENGNYLSKFSDPVVPTLITGVYADGTDFYSYAELTNKIFNTKIAATENSRLEFWYKGDNMKSSDGFNVIIGAGNNDNQNCFQVRYFVNDNDRIIINLGGDDIIIEGWDDTVWHHLIVSKAEGLWIDGEKKKEYESTIYYPPEGEFYINGIGYSKDGSRSANGTFGMIKIDDVVIIPTVNGFQNVNTGELIEVVKNGGYKFTENTIKNGEGELYKTINVNVLPKINVKEAGIKFAYGTFTEVPEWADFEGIRDMSNMFSNCQSIKTIPMIDTSNVTNMDRMFYQCGNLQTIPLLDTSNVINMNEMFYQCGNLQAIPQFDTSNVTNMNNMFESCNSLVSLPALNAQSLNMPSYYGIFGWGELPNLTDFGGFLNLKSSLTSDDNLKRLPNLTKESCLNILNGLYDFTGNGETPNDNQGQLKVHPNFLATVGDKICIGVLKGWSISA